MRSRSALAVIHSLRLVKLEECENMTFPGTDRNFLVNPRSYYARVKVCFNYTRFASTSCISTLMRIVTRKRIFNTALLHQSKRECFISRHNHNVFYKCCLPCEVSLCQLGEMLFYFVPHMMLGEFLPKLDLLHSSLVI